LISAARLGGTNIHPSVLPDNGGHHTSFWGIVDQTPLGATIHWLSENLDSGGIIAQKTISDDGFITANLLRERQRRLCIELFAENLDRVVRGEVVHSEGMPCHFHALSEIRAATTFHESDVVDFSTLLRLGRATAFGGNGITVKRSDGRSAKIGLAVTQLPDDELT
jgi:methionyl-tRNA formyltransferase